MDSPRPLAARRRRASSGVSPARCVRSPVALTATSWSPRRELALEDWQRQGRMLGVITRGGGWWLGDWVRYGNARYGERYRAAAESSGYDVQSLMNMAYVASRFEISRRREKLSFSHHAELAGLPPHDQELWLDRAEVGGLSVHSLRAELRRMRRREAERIGPGGPRGQDRRDAGPDRNPVTSVRSGQPRPVPPRSSGQEAGPSERAVANGEASAGHALSVVDEVVCPECGHRFPQPIQWTGDVSATEAHLEVNAT
jgi:hypothetical protein